MWDGVMLTIQQSEIANHALRKLSEFLKSLTARRCFRQSARSQPSGNLAENGEGHRAGALDEERKTWHCKQLAKEVVVVHGLLMRSLFACDILRSSPQRVSLARSTSASLRF
jgi:hypothetical protein